MLHSCLEEVFRVINQDKPVYYFAPIKDYNQKEGIDFSTFESPAPLTIENIKRVPAGAALYIDGEADYDLSDSILSLKKGQILFWTSIGL